MNTEKAIPYTWAEMEDQIRDLILAQASTLKEFGPGENSIVSRFLGFETDLDLADFPDEEKQKIDIERHQLYRDVYAAYHYLYQLEDRHIADYGQWHRVGCGLLSGSYPTSDPEGEPTPLCQMNNPPLRKVLQAFFARWGLEADDYLPTLSDLSLLSGLSEASVRASLSKEGFSIERDTNSNSSVLPAEDALIWLQKRRGFIPNKGMISLEALQARQQRIINGDTPFPLAFKWMIEGHEISETELSSRTASDPEWLTALLAGKKVAIDIDALSNLAREFGVSRSKFVARAVEYLLSD